MNAHFLRKPRWPWVGAVTHHGRLNAAGLGEPESESADRVAVRPPAGAVDEKGYLDRHIVLHRILVQKWVEAACAHERTSHFS